LSGTNIVNFGEELTIPFDDYGHITASDTLSIKLPMINKID
jgi:hypothetical protein